VDVMSFLGCSVFFNFLADPVGRLRLNACAGISPEVRRQLEWLDYGVAVCGCAARDACRIVAEHIGNTPDPRTDLVRSLGIQAYACHPLLGRQGAVLGTLSFGTCTRPRFTDDELSLMKTVADHVSIALQRLRDEEAIRRLNAELEQRVHLRTAELEASNQELEAFCYSVSHDLRAPLRGIDGFSQALLEDAGGQLQPEAQEDIRWIRSECQTMGQLIDDLLNLSRLTRTAMKRQAVDLSGLVEQIAGGLRESAPERRVNFSIAPDLTVDGDPNLLRAALANLLENAWKYTGKREEALIEFGSSPADGPPGALGGPVFFVRDNGVGFDMAYADKLFAPFQRLHSVKEFPGTGIGLATVQRVIHRHGGRIWAEGAPGRGATFYFAFSAGGRPHD
jgi:signal transduction histidine kinase